MLEGCLLGQCHLNHQGVGEMLISAQLPASWETAPKPWTPGQGTGPERWMEWLGAGWGSLDSFWACS